MNRVMALDLGDARIGIAMSDLMKIIANGYETYNRTKNLQKDLEYISGLVKPNLVDTIVMGLPINMDGTQGERVEITKAFAEELAKYTDAKIVFQDERLSTVSAERVLLDADVRRDKRKTVIDKIAATIILQHYLDIHKF